MISNSFEQFPKNQFNESDPTIKPIDLKLVQNLFQTKKKIFMERWTLYNTSSFQPRPAPEFETGLEVASEIQIVPGLILSGSVRKSVLTNLTDNKRLNSGSFADAF